MQGLEQQTAEELLDDEHGAFDDIRANICGEEANPSGSFRACEATRHLLVPYNCGIQLAWRDLGQALHRGLESKSKLRPFQYTKETDPCCVLSQAMAFTANKLLAMLPSQGQWVNPGEFCVHWSLRPFRRFGNTSMSYASITLSLSVLDNYYGTIAKKTLDSPSPIFTSAVIAWTMPRGVDHMSSMWWNGMEWDRIE